MSKALQRGTRPCSISPRKAGLVWIHASAIVCMVLGAVSGPALSANVPKVIGKTGPTRSIAPYYETISSQGTNQPPLEKAKLANSVLPIRTPEMSAGPVVAREVDAKMLDRPFFILGSDRRSREWLARNHDRLVQIQAVGLLVQAETLADLRGIADLGVGIPIAPVPGSDFATRFGLTTYPVLISSGWIEQ